MLYEFELEGFILTYSGYMRYERDSITIPFKDEVPPLPHREEEYDEENDEYSPPPVMTLGTHSTGMYFAKYAPLLKSSRTRTPCPDDVAVEALQTLKTRLRLDYLP
jgi:hypothetical protein